VNNAEKTHVRLARSIKRQCAWRRHGVQGTTS
jgi:hypothetical protein